MSIIRKTHENWLPSVIDDMFKTDWLGGTSQVNSIGVSIPAVNITENDDAFEIALAAPGKTRDDFHIELDNDVLTISSSSKNTDENGVKTIRYTRREFSYSNFKRAFSLPESVDNAIISAHYSNGILLLTMPKKEESKVQAKRMIEVV